MPIPLPEPLVSSVDCPRTQAPSPPASSRKSWERAWVQGYRGPYILAPEKVSTKLH